MADAIYNNKNMIEQVSSLNITPIIWHRKNSKMKFNKHEQKIYKNRIIIENVFSWLFKNRRLNKTYDKKICTYYSFLFMALIKILLKRM